MKMLVPSCSPWLSPAPRAARSVGSDGHRNKKAKRSQLVIIPNTMNYESVLDYSPYIEHTGNQAQPASKVYLVTGLQLRRREV
jgi:hypothetical protein